MSPRCWRLSSVYRTLCRQWNDAAQCTDWAQITCPECRAVRQRWLDALGAVAGAVPSREAS